MVTKAPLRMESDDNGDLSVDPPSEARESISLLCRGKKAQISREKVNPGNTIGGAKVENLTVSIEAVLGSFSFPPKKVVATASADDLVSTANCAWSRAGSLSVLRRIDLDASMAPWFKSET